MAVRFVSDSGCCAIGLACRCGKCFFIVSVSDEFCTACGNSACKFHGPYPAFMAYQFAISALPLNLGMLMLPVASVFAYVSDKSFV